MAEKEYIEREAVNDLIKAECSPKVAAYLIDAVATVPAADVRPVARGKWIQKKSWTRGVCSACSWEIAFVTGNSYNFCPNCGADMREES